MKKVLVYGSFDFFHEGHIKLLERAKLFGEKLYVGVSSEGFNLKKGKANYQSLEKRREKVIQFEGVVEVFVQNSFEQKKYDIERYGIDFLVAGDDWIGANDHLEEYCEVIYLPRTPGICSTEIREKLKKQEEMIQESFDGGILA